MPGSTLEFLAYRIIYQAVHARHGEMLQLLNTLKKVKPAVRPVCRARSKGRIALCGSRAVRCRAPGVVASLAGVGQNWECG